MKRPWHALSRGEKALSVAVAACLAAAVFVRPLASVVSRGYAVWSACCLTNEDLEALPTGGNSFVLADGPPDPWGRQFHFFGSHAARFVYSVGPNGTDENGAGDDVVVASSERYTFVAWSPAFFAGAAIVLVWSWLVLRLVKAPRSESLEKEFGRALGIATLPTAAGTALALATVQDLSLFTPIPVKGVAIPPGFAVALCLGIVSSVVALRLRHRASLALEPADTARVRRRVRPHVLALVLTVIALAYVAARVVDARRAAWARDRLLVSAQLGFFLSVDEVLSGDDLEPLRVIVTHPTRTLYSALRSGKGLRPIGRLGADAVPFMINEVKGPCVSENPLDGAAWRHLLAFDPQLEQLAGNATAQPEAFEQVLLTHADLIAARVGRRRVLEVLAPWLGDCRSFSWQSPILIRDLAAEAFTKLAGDAHFLPAPDRTARYNIDDWRASIVSIQSWWRAEALKPTLPPVGWIAVNGKNLPAHPGLPGVAIRLDSALVWQCTDETGILQVAGPLAPGAHAITLDDVTGKKAFDVPVTVPPEGEAWIDVDFATGVVKVTNAEAK